MIRMVQFIQKTEDLDFLLLADNNFFFKVLAELSDTEYFTFFIFSTNRGPLVENSTN